MRTIITFLLAILSMQCVGQEIAGKVLDMNKEPIISAKLLVYQGGILKGTTLTDYDGNYILKPLDAGQYELVATYSHFDSITVTGIVATPAERTTQDFNLMKSGITAKNVKHKWVKPLINPNRITIPHGDPERLPTTNVEDIVSTPGGIPQYRNHGLTLPGARDTGPLYIIDGIVIQTAPGIDVMNCVVELPDNIFDPIKRHIFTREEIDQMPVSSINDIVSLLPGVYQQQRGGSLSIFGSRPEGVHYIIDGMQ